jgi:hypothetical protein
MSHLSPIPEWPPANVVAELDRAARALDELMARGAELRLRIDESSLRIELIDGTRRSLTPTELFEVLDDG